MNNHPEQPPAVTSLLLAPRVPLHVIRGSLPEALEDEAVYMRRMLAELHRQYAESSEPYIKRLAAIEALRPIRMVVSFG